MSAADRPLSTAARLPTAAAKPLQALGASRLLMRKCACGANASGLTGKCSECDKKKILGLQTKLQVNEPGDVYEQEADRIADQVLAKPARPDVSNAPPRIQRFFSGAHAGTAADTQSLRAPPIVRQVLSGAGEPLDTTTRADMEGRFGHDFGQIRIHQDSAAAQSASVMNARAYTVGQHVVFGAGRYSPKTLEGRGLLAHELTHTVQQRGSSPNFAALTLGPPSGSASELEAERSRAAVRSGIPIGKISERASSVVQRDEGQPAGGCGFCYGNTKNVGTEAHTRIASAFRNQNPTINTEFRVLAPSAGDENGQLDLVVFTGDNTAHIGEIKPANPAGLLQGDIDLIDYSRQLEHLGFKVKRLILPPPIDAISFPTRARPPCLQEHLLYVNPPVQGIYGYWCTPDYRVLAASGCKCDDGKRKDEPQQQQQKLNLPLIIGTGALVAAAAITASVVRPKVPTPKPIVRPTVPVVTPKPGTVTPIRQPKPFTPGRTATPHHRPSTAGRSGGGAGRVAGGIGIAAGLAFTVYEVYSLLSAFDDAKQQIAALDAYREQFWKELDEELARQKKAAKDVPPTQVVTAPAVQPAKQPDPPPQKPVEKTVKIPVYSLSRALKLTKSEIEVPSSALGVLYEPVSFRTLTSPGKFTTAIESAQVDCSKMGAGVGIASGWQQLAGYASPYDAARLKAVLADQLTLVRAKCILSGQTPHPAAQPDSDEVTAVITTPEGTVTATCRKVGAASFSCDKDGDFASLKEVTEDEFSNDRYQFTLEVSLVRVRGGKSERFDRVVSTSVEDPDDPFAVPDVTKEGSVPSDAVDPDRYPAGSALSYILLNYYSSWGDS